MSSLLADLVRKQTATSLLGVFSRTIDKVAEEMAHDLLRDPEIRAQLQQLVRAAFQQALTELHEPAPAPPEPSRDVELMKMLREQRDLIAKMRAREDRKDETE